MNEIYVTRVSAVLDNFTGAHTATYQSSQSELKQEEDKSLTKINLILLSSACTRITAMAPGTRQRNRLS